MQREFAFTAQQYSTVQLQKIPRFRWYILH